MWMDKLCLGTVQFGLEYGINNKWGKPTREQVFAMLDTAIAKGVNYIDTAAAYGNAEESLGEFIEYRGLNTKKIRFISKLRPNLFYQSQREIEKTISSEIKSSLQRLQIDQLFAYLLHTPADFYNSSVMAALQAAKEEGLIAGLGVSIYETDHALDVVKSGMVDCIQVPYNLFDQRLDKTDFFKIARDNKVIVFARSPFLQGLLFMQAEQVPRRLQLARQYLIDFEKIIKGFSWSRAEAALYFSLCHEGIDYVVFGVDNMKQLKENLEISSADKDFRECMEGLKRTFTNIEKEIVIPSLWANFEPQAQKKE